ncbi:hypothetical protein SAMN06265171_105224 [Chryseobacterium rhizoplanae]|uniref:Uncharacterized protein n=1 Tax=Chryseobacterium rhizoplanae TaxID=1609531 RepID=A0A521DKY9_9FLAO|nr:hypothetical protein SAMN06265171_105224 [Chryseobacterium rhizoplanae]
MIPGITNDKTLVNVFLTPNAKGTIISSSGLYTDLQEELEQY